jgi:hypothetical protein
MAGFISENAIVNYLERKKKEHLDKGKFTGGNPFNITVEVSVFTTAFQMNKYNAIMQVIEKQKIINKDDPIKLIILELTGDTITLDCDAFLLDKELMNTARYIERLNHVIIGKTDDEYTVIGYIENPSSGSTRIQAKPCTTFKLNNSGLQNKCARLPEIIKGIIFKCINKRYTNRLQPAAMKAYYTPTTKEYEKEVVAENVVEAQLAEAAEAAKIKEEDKCDFKALLKSKIKNNESNEYCKVTDEGLLERIQQNIDGNKDVDINGVNDLIKTRLVNLKKVKEEEDADEDEEKEREDGKTISEKKEAFMIKEANEMYVISREVSKKISEGNTYSSEKFFKEYLKNTMVTEQEENAAELVAEATTPVATAVETPVSAPETEAPITGTAATETEAPVAEAPVAAAVTGEAEAAAEATPEAEAPEASAEAPGPKEVTLPQPQQNLKGVVKRVIKQRRKSPVNPFTYTPI